MTTRTDVSVEYNSSPRVVEVATPSTEMGMQDFVDTLRKQEDSFQGMGNAKLINASGKEDLGDGVSVGITVASQNTLLAFEARRTPAETGTVTGSPASPVAGRQILQDTAALFQTNNVARGSLVVNFTDNSVADVVSVDSETQLTTKTLVNGTGNTYDVTDVYHVFNIVQVKALGGNLTAVDDAQAVISPILPTAFTQVVVASSSSATSVVTGSGVTAQDKVDIIDELMTRVMENGETFAEAMRLMRAEAAGDIVKTGSLHHIKSADGGTTRITATADADGRDVTATDGT